MIPDIYVAGPSVEIVRCEHWISKLDQEGFRITHNWTRAVEQFGSEGSKLREHQLRMYARGDLRGVDDAHLVWVLMPTNGRTTIGAWVEFGYALNRGKYIVVSPPERKNIFARLPIVVECDSDQLAFEYIQKFSA